MTLRNQINLLVIIPFVALLTIGGLKGSADFSRFLTARSAQSETDTALSLMNLVHFLQIERGQSAGFLSSGSTAFNTGMMRNRAKVDDAMRRVPESAQTEISALRNLQSTRTIITGQSIEVADMAAYYTGVIAEILDHIDDKLMLEDNPEIAQLGAGLVALSTAKEAAGQQRAVGTAGIGSGGFTLSAYRKFVQTGITEARFLENATISLPKFIADPRFDAGLQQAGLPGIREAVVAAGPMGTLPNVRAEEWFQRTTNWITFLYGIEENAARALTEIAQREARSSLIALLLTVVLFLASVVSCSIIGVRFIRTFDRQMNSLQDDLDKLSRKEFSFEPANLEAKTEIGELSRSMEITRAALEEADQKFEIIEAERNSVIGTLDEHLAKLSQRDLACTIAESFPEAYERLRKSFNLSVETLSGTLMHVVDATESINNGATEMSRASDDLSRRTESQAATLEETAAALEQMTMSIKSAADGARDVEKTMNDARSEAETSGEIVKNAVTAMTEIEQSSAKIGQIIVMIDDISFQTNLLALNAGVEAARAGEAGKGFAVVASEVRALAQRSSEAATEIKALIGDSSQQIELGVDLVRKTGEAIQSIVERVNEISTMVSGIAESASEQSTGVAEINTGVTQLDSVTQKNTAMVQESTAACHLLHADATRLAELMEQFVIGRGARRAPAAQPVEAMPVTAHDAEVPGDDWQPDEAEHDTARAVGVKWEDF